MKRQGTGTAISVEVSTLSEIDGGGIIRMLIHGIQFDLMCD